MHVNNFLIAVGGIVGAEKVGNRSRRKKIGD